jgi:hypothetical protein
MAPPPLDPTPHQEQNPGTYPTIGTPGIKPFPGSILDRHSGIYSQELGSNRKVLEEFDFLSHIQQAKYPDFLEI